MCAALKKGDLVESGRLGRKCGGTASEADEAIDALAQACSPRRLGRKRRQAPRNAEDAAGRECQEVGGWQVELERTNLPAPQAPEVGG